MLEITVTFAVRGDSRFGPDHGRSLHDQIMNQNSHSAASRHYAVFISYRRGMGLHQARNLFDTLKARLGKDFPVFLDLNETGSGDFTQRIYPAIQRSKRFLWLVTSDSFEKRAGQDYYIKELETAIKAECLIVPVLYIPAGQYLSKLPDKLRPYLQHCDYITYTAEYHDAFMERLITQYLRIALPPTPTAPSPAPSALLDDVRRDVALMRDRVGTALTPYVKPAFLVLAGVVCVCFPGALMMRCSSSPVQERLPSGATAVNPPPASPPKQTPARVTLNRVSESASNAASGFSFASVDEPSPEESAAVAALSSSEPTRADATPSVKEEKRESRYRLVLSEPRSVTEEIYPQKVEDFDVRYARCYAPTFSPDGNNIALSIVGGTCYAFNLADKNRVGEWEVKESAVDCMYSRDGHSILIVSNNAGPKLFALDREGVSYEKNLSGNGCYGASCSADAHYLAYASGNEVGVVDTRADRVVYRKFNQGGGYEAVAVSPKEDMVAFGSPEKDVKLVEFLTKKVLFTIPALQGVSSLSFSDDGKRLCITSRYGADVYVIDVASGKRIYTGFGKAAALSPEGRFVATNGYVYGGLGNYNGPGGPGYIADLETGKTIATLSRDAGGQKERMRFSPDGRHLAIGDEIWDTSELYTPIKQEK